MTQQEIFTQNLNYYVELTGKSQRQICYDLDIIPATFNMWINGKALPRMGKVQALADYFNISKSCLIDERTEDTDDRLTQLISTYNDLSDENKTLLCKIAKSML